jgi:hypothetical protein
MTETKDNLTNERLSGAYNDNFQLALYAINLAQNELLSGKEVHISTLIERLRRNPHEEIVRVAPESTEEY